MLRRCALVVTLALALAGCGSAAAPTPTSTPSAAPTPSPTPRRTPSPTPSPTASPSPSIGSADPFDGLAYTLDLPAGWIVFDPNSEASKATFDAVARANPAMAASMQMVLSDPSTRLATNPLLGNALVALTLPSNGLSLDTIGKSVAAQYQLVPGLITKPIAKKVRLPGG